MKNLYKKYSESDLRELKRAYKEAVEIFNRGWKYISCNYSVMVTAQDGMARLNNFRKNVVQVVDDTYVKLRAAGVDPDSILKIQFPGMVEHKQVEEKKPFVFFLAADLLGGEIIQVLVKGATPVDKKIPWYRPQELKILGSFDSDELRALDDCSSAELDDWATEKAKAILFVHNAKKMFECGG